MLHKGIITSKYKLKEIKKKGDNLCFFKLKQKHHYYIWSSYISFIIEWRQIPSVMLIPIYT